MSRRSKLALILAIAALPLLSVAPAGAQTHALAPGVLCKKVTPAQVSKALGIKATKVSTTINGTVTVCWYAVGKLAHAAYVRSQTGTTPASFAAEKKLAKTYGENPATDKHFGSYPAFSVRVGTAAYGYTYGVTVLKKSTQLDVGGSKTTLAKVEALAKQVLPSL